MWRLRLDPDAYEGSVVQWDEAVWDEDEELWIYRVVYGEVGYLEARLPNWSRESALVVVRNTESGPKSEAFGWRR